MNPHQQIPTSMDPLKMRLLLGRDQWGVPQVFGPTGWRFDRLDATARILITDGPSDPDRPADDWRHASISRPDRMPDYTDLVLLHQLGWPDGYAYQVFAKPTDHINIHAHTLHLWGRPDGRRILPDFGAHGTI